MVTGVMPQVLPAFIGVGMYRLDINFRTSTILGYVGAGGIGSAAAALPERPAVLRRPSAW
jgi:phosphonate transport system permease protein